VEFCAYFRLVNGRYTIQSKRIAALLLMVIFVFIQVGKTLHTHSYSYQCFPYNAAQEIKQSADCQICDFHFSKDCDGERAFIEADVIKEFPILCSYFQSFLTASIGLIYADRGPPTQSI
jgi:queuine/archaeosine tRNA-ribosyltransferase